MQYNNYWGAKVTDSALSVADSALSQANSELGQADSKRRQAGMSWDRLKNTIHAYYTVRLHDTREGE